MGKFPSYEEEPGTGTGTVPESGTDPEPEPAPKSQNRSSLTAVTVTSPGDERFVLVGTFRPYIVSVPGLLRYFLLNKTGTSTGMAILSKSIVSPSARH